MKKTKCLLMLLMAVVMMAMSPTRVWAENVTLDASTWKKVLAEIEDARAEYSDTYTITFADSYSGTPKYTESVGTGVNIYNDSESVYNYVVAPTTAGDVIMAPADCSGLFKDLSNLTSITFDNFNISNVTDLSGMITNCTGLQHIYVHCDKVKTYKAALSSYASIISRIGTGNHDYTNGICSACSAIEPATPVYAEDGTTIDHYNIGNAGQLLWFSNFVNKKENGLYHNCNTNAVLTADIVVNDGEFDEDGNFTATGASETSTPISVTPISSSDENCYSGTFDGDGHTISGLYFVGGADDTFVGLFGNLSSSPAGTVKRLGLTNVYYSGCANSCQLGAVVGHNWGGTIENCYSTGVLKNTGTGNPYTGGICGYNNGTITNCYTTITSSVYDYESSGDGVTNCYALTTYGNTQAANFASGEICYLLNGSRSEGTAESPLVWYQNLSAEGGDSYPVLKAASDGSNTVYCGYDGCTLSYANAALSQTQGDHNFDSKTLCDQSQKHDFAGFYYYLCDKCGAKSEHTYVVIKDYAPDEDNDKNLELTVTTDGETTTYSTSEAIELTDANQFANVNVAFSTTQAPTYTREMTSDWGTIVLPFAVAAQTNDYDLYRCETLLDNRLVMRILPANEAVPAGYPAFVRKKTDAESITFTGTGNVVNTAPPSSENNGNTILLKGAYTTSRLNNGYANNNYFIYNDKFWNVNQLSDDQTVTILPFHAYIQVASSEEGPGNMNAQLRIEVAGETTSIENVSSISPLGESEGVIYNLNGQRLAAPQKGVNIINGKKVMVK